MSRIRFFIISVFLMSLISINLFAQNKLSVFTSTGYTNHLIRKGINWELGLDYEIFKRLDIATAYRYNYMNYKVDNKVEVNSISIYLSWIILNKNSQRLLAGPGFSYGKYLRYTDNIGFEKEYTDKWINPVRIQYDYTFPKKIRIGGIVSLYGDDGDGTAYFGLLVGYKF